MMAREVFLNVYLVIAFLAIADAYLYLRVEPQNAVIEPGYTQKMSLTCRDSRTSWGPSNLVSIIISKSDNSMSDFSDIVSIRSDPSGDLLTDIALSSRARANGSLDTRYLEIVWTNPSSQDSGAYQCASYSLDNTGRPVVDSRIIEINASSPDVEDLNDRVIRLQDTFNDLTKRFETLENAIKDTVKLPNFYKVSSKFRNRRYYLTYTYTGIKEAEVECELEGGYLAEIDDFEEYNFIKRFLDYPYKLNYDVVVGATNENTGGEWVHVFSHRNMSNMTYALWAGNGTDSTAVGCIALSMREQRKFVTTGCGKVFDTRSLCEIPN